eukprot:g79734.t1
MVVVLSCFLASLLLLTAHAYRYGEAVGVLKRSQYKGFRSDWTDMNPEHMPRFGMDRVVELQEGAIGDIIDPKEPFKNIYTYIYT